MARMADAWNGTTLTVTKYGDEVDKSSKKTDRSRGSLRRLGSDAVRLNQAFGLLGKTISAAKIPALAAVAGVAAQAITTMIGGVAALTAALGPLTGLLAALPALYSSIGQAVISTVAAFSPVTSVLKEMGAAHESAKTSATQNGKAQKAAAKAVESAEKQLTAASREQREAVRELTAARQEARRALQDLRLESEGAALSEKRAVLSLQEAKKALSRSAVEGAPSSEVKNLALSVEEAELGLRESRLDRKRTDDELARSEAKGIGRSEQVVAAKQQVRQAEQGVREAAAGVAEALEQQREAATGASAAASKLASKFAELSPQAQRFAKYVFGLKDKLRALQAAAGRKMFPGMESGLKSALKNFPVLERVMGKTGGAVGRLAERAGELLGSNGFGERFEKIGNNNAKTIGRLGGTAILLVDALSHVMVAARPLVNWITKGAQAFGEWADKAAAAKQKSGEMAAFFDKTKQTLRQVWTVVKELGGAFYNIGRQAAPLGRTILKSLGESATSFREWTESASGKNKIAAYFKEIKAPLFEMGRLVRDVVNSFFEMGKSDGLYKTIHSIRKEVLPALTRFIEVTTSAFGPVLVETLLAILPLVETFAGSSGPLVVMMKTLKLMAEVATWVLSASPVLKAAAVTMVGAAAIFKGVKIAGTLTGLGKLVGMWNAVKVAAVGAKVAEEAAATPGLLGALGRRGGVKGIAKSGAGMLGLGAVAATTVAPAGMLSAADMGAVGLAPKVAGAAAAVPPAAPWIALGAAVVAVGVGIWQLYKHSETFREIVEPVTDAAVEGFNEIKKSFGPLGDAVGDLARSFGGNGELAKNLSFLWKYAKPMVELIANVFKVTLVGAVKGAIAALAQVIRGIAKILSGQVQIIRGVVEVITGVLTLNFDKAWKGIKNIFGGAIKTVLGVLQIGFSPVVGIVTHIGHVMSKAFGGVWDLVQGVFKGGINAVIGLVNDMIGLVNKLPFIELGEIGYVGGDGGGSARPDRRGRHAGTGAGQRRAGQPIVKQRGGFIDDGVPGRDSVPALLERDEYVLNKRAVAAVGGPGVLDEINFKHAPRFSVGGAIGGAAGAVGGAARSAVGGGAGAVLDALPDPSSVLPGWLAGVGSYMKDRLVDWVEGEEEKSGRLIVGAGAYKGPVPKIFADVLRDHRAPYRSSLALYEAGIQESGLRNIDYGHSSSRGVLQLLASTAAGLGVSPMDVGAVASLFLTRGFWGHGGAISLARRNPEMPPGEIAQMVQGSAYPDAYEPHRPQAESLMKRYGLRFKGQEMRMARGGLAGRAARALVTMASGGMVNVPRDPNHASDPNDSVAASIVDLVSAYVGRFDTDITAGYDPGGGHVSPGHNVTGTATDIVPASGNWGGAFEKGLSLLAKTGFEVGYDGSVPGTESWPNHGRGNHAHVEWVGNGTASGARQALRDAIGPDPERAGAAGAGARARPGPDPMPKGVKVGGAYTGAGGGTGTVGGYAAVAPLQFGGLPKTPEACTKELSQRRQQLEKYKMATREDDAKKDKRIMRALEANIRALRARIRALVKHRAKLIAKKRTAAAVAKITGQADFPYWNDERSGVLPTLQRAWETAEQYAGQVIDLEPEDEAEARAYIAGREEPAYRAVLGAEGAWRNAIIGAGGSGTEMAGRWGIFPGPERGRWRGQIDSLTERIREIKGYRKTKPNAWKKHRGEIPALEAKVKALRANITRTRGETIPSWEEQLEQVQGLGANVELVSPLPAEPQAGRFGGYIWDTQSAIRDLGLRLKGGGPEDSATAELYKQLATEARQREAVLRLQMGNFASVGANGGPVPAFGGVYHSGGVVPGRSGEERVIIAESGEIIAQPSQIAGPAGNRGALPQPVVIVEDGAVDAERIRVIYRDEQEKDISKSRRRIGA